MANAELLEKKIKENRYSKKLLAEKLGLTTQGLRNKMSGKCDFYSREAWKLSELLNLNTDEILAIFFDQMGHPQSTSPDKSHHEGN